MKLYDRFSESRDWESANNRDYQRKYRLHGNVRVHNTTLKSYGHVCLGCNLHRAELEFAGYANCKNCRAKHGRKKR